MPANIDFVIKRWSAWTPNLVCADHWRDWASGLRDMEGEEPVDVSFLPAMTRRRLSGCSKIALKVANDCLQGDTADYSIFCSRHGELQRTIKILTDINELERPSPTAFSMSVHNTASGLFSITRKDCHPGTATSSGVDTLETALICAAARIHSGRSRQVLVVYADEPLPGLFGSFNLGPELPLAAGFLISADQACEGSVCVNMAVKGSKAETMGAESKERTEGSCLALLRQVLSGSGCFSTLSKRLGWDWNVDVKAA